MSFLKPLTLFLQNKNCDMVVAFDEAQNTDSQYVKPEFCVKIDRVASKN
jgi:hypothetical protein